MKKFTQTTLIALLLSSSVFSQTKNEPVKNPSGGTIVSQASDSRLILLSPADGKLFNGSEGSKPVLFRWTAVSPKPKEAVTYRLKVWQLMQGQNGMEAMRNNQPMITKDVANITQAAISNLYTGPCRPPYLCEFVWAVEVLNREGASISNDYTAGASFKFEIENAATEYIEGGNKGNAGNTGMPTGKSAYKRLDKSNPTAKNIGQEETISTVSLNGLPPGQPVLKGGKVKAQGDPVHGVDIKPGMKKQDKELDKNQPTAKKQHKPLTQTINLPVEKLEYDAEGNVTAVLFKTENGDPAVVKVVVAGSKSISGGLMQNTEKGESVIVKVIVAGSNSLSGGVK